MRRATFDAIAPLAKIYDGFLIHSNGGAGAVLSGTKRPPNPTLLRTDLNRPVLNFETETDAVNHVPARQADDRNHRLWEAAGTAHVDNDALKLFGYLEHSQTPLAADPSCTSPFNTVPESYLMDAAYADLQEWVPRIKEMERSAKEVHAIMNNNYSNYSVKNAQQLEKLLDAWQK